MDGLRKPFQGVGNIIRFNWHFYVLAFTAVLMLFVLRHSFGSVFHMVANVCLIAILWSTLVSLLVSAYIYDLSGLYTFSWLKDLRQHSRQTILNIHSGFDETSHLIHRKFEKAELTVVDFYDPVKHTEISIKRARKVYPPFPGTIVVSTNHLPVACGKTDLVFVILAAHEIRDDEERIGFFKEMKRVLRGEGQIIVTEHLRDWPNFLAYTIGFFHFHSKATWQKTFCSAGLTVVKEIKLNPFITTFILEQNANAS